MSRWPLGGHDNRRELIDRGRNKEKPRCRIGVGMEQRDRDLGSSMVVAEHERRDMNMGDIVQIKERECDWHNTEVDRTIGNIPMTGVGC